MQDKDWLNALLLIFSGTTRILYQGIHRKNWAWKDFKKAFKRKFGISTTDKDITRDLMLQTQAKGESVSSFIASSTFIASKLKVPLSQ